MAQKGSVQAFVLVAIILIGLIGGYIYFDNSSPKESLKSPAGKAPDIKNYVNKALGFQFEYSDKELKVLEDSEEAFNKRGNGKFRQNFKGYVTYEPGIFLGAVVVLDEKGSYELNPLTIWVFENPKELNVEDWYKNYWYYPFVWGDYTQRNKLVAPVNEATISGSLSKSGIVDYRPGKPKFIYLPKDKKMYLFRIIGEKGDKILENFKFK